MIAMAATGMNETILRNQESRVWGITTYFNPSKYVRRRTNYARFRRESRVPLLTVELSLDGNFELGPSDADILIQVTSDSVLWHKESLLNIALQRLPREIEYFAWLDCDIVLPDPDWPSRLISELGSARVVQLFDRLYDLGPTESLQSTLPPLFDRPTGLGIASLMSTGAVPASGFKPQNSRDMRSTSFGLAWGARVSDIRTFGFYDGMVLGSGDRAMFCAAMADFTPTIETLCLSRSRIDHYLEWAKPYARLIDRRVSFLPGPIFHLWHGDIVHRHYRDRHRNLAALDFDLERDLERCALGLWQWKPGRQQLHRFFKSYFDARLEDGETAGSERKQHFRPEYQEEMCHESQPKVR
jgi:hypothetical protein